jgi:predicted molibdopterin-dependent oxidoreductase YjgC
MTRMSLRIANVARPAPVTITVEGIPIVAHPGESLAAALIAAGHWRFGEGEDLARPRTAVCMMGVCQQCLLRVDGRLVQACLTPIIAGQEVTPA